jgi:hypothetical protein
VTERDPNRSNPIPSSGGMSKGRRPTIVDGLGKGGLRPGHVLGVVLLGAGEGLDNI